MSAASPQWAASLRCPPNRRHSALPVNGREFPLGVLGCGFGNLGMANGGKARRWMEGCREIAAAAGKLTLGTRVASVMDREADSWRLFDEQRRHGPVDVMVRAHHNRRSEQGAGGKLLANLSAGPRTIWKWKCRG